MFIFPESDGRVALINFPPVLTLTLVVSLAESSTLASKEGIPYFCLARNTLGTARSQAVTLRYPGRCRRRGRKFLFYLHATDLTFYYNA